LFEVLLCEFSMTAGVPLPAERFPERRQALNEMRALVEGIGRPDLIMKVQARQIPVYLEMGELAAAEAEMAAYGELLARFSGFVWLQFSFEAMHAILHGEFAAAERAADRALELARAGNDEVAEGVYGVQMFTIRREQGRLAEIAPVLKRFIDENPRDAAWRPGLAVIAGDLGFESAARKAFEELAADGFASVPRDFTWPAALCLLSIVCAALADAERAEELSWHYRAHAGHLVVVGWGDACTGAVDRYLGMLAATACRWDDAVLHYRAAMETERAVGARPALVRTRACFAGALHGRRGPGDAAEAEALLAEARAEAQALGMRGTMIIPRCVEDPPTGTA
jgi:hypothetical protein